MAFKNFGERFEAIGGQFQARGGRMTAESGDVGRAGAKGFVKVEAGDRPARPLATTVVDRDDDRRPMVVIHQPSRDDADHPGVPTFLAQDDRASVAELVFVDQCASLFEHRSFQILPTFIA